MLTDVLFAGRLKSDVVMLTFKKGQNYDIIGLKILTKSLRYAMTKCTRVVLDIESVPFKISHKETSIA